MSAEAVLDYLRTHDVTTSAEIAEATGLSRNAVELTVRRLNGAGYSIVNLHRQGGHTAALWQLQFDLDRAALRRVCAVDGCPTVLSRSNSTRYCRRHLYEQAWDELSRQIDEALALAYPPEQLVLEGVAP